MFASTAKSIMATACLLLALSQSLPANSQSQQGNTETNINSFDHLASLYRTDREPRSFKRWCWLKPGKEKYFYYYVVRADGTTSTKMTFEKLKQVPDSRELHDSHPNLYWVQWGGMTFGSFFGGIVSSAITGH